MEIPLSGFHLLHRLIHYGAVFNTVALTQKVKLSKKCTDCFICEDAKMLKLIEGLH